MISYWYGKPIDTLTREELIAVIEHLSEELKLDRARHDRDMNMLATFGAPRETRDGLAVIRDWLKSV